MEIDNLWADRSNTVSKNREKLPIVFRHQPFILKTMPKRAAKKVVKKVTKKTIKKSTGAGRPKGSGPYGCETKAVRIPIHLESDVKAFVMKKVKGAK